MKKFLNVLVWGVFCWVVVFGFGGDLWLGKCVVGGHVLGMKDPRFEALARQLVNYSTNLREGEHILFDLQEVPEAFAVALVRAARARGGHPHVRVSSARVQRELLLGATREQFALEGDWALREMEAMQAYVAVRGSHNITENSDVDGGRLQLVTDLMRPAINHRVNRTRWCVLRWPHAAMAQLAGMSTEAFEDFYFEVCLLDYEGLLPAMGELKALMERTSQVHILGPGTDLRFSIAGVPAVVCGGHYNIPDGEVFTAPVRESVEGRVSFNAPTIYRGQAFDGVVLHFHQGRIMRAEAGSEAQTRALEDVLDSDEGARFIGEFALGFNPFIREPMRDILFDEKIAGSFHFTPGQAYEEADNGNRSQVHWDLVCIQREDYGGGEIYFDGQLVRQDGVFLPSALAALNGG